MANVGECYLSYACEGLEDCVDGVIDRVKWRAGLALNWMEQRVQSVVVYIAVLWTYSFYWQLYLSCLLMIALVSFNVINAFSFKRTVLYTLQYFSQL